MGNFASEIRRLLHPVDPYAGFDPAPYPNDLQGGEITGGMEQLFDSVKPKLLIEVGSWKGRTACFWSSLMKKHSIDGAVVCVDTWLGGFEHLQAHTSPEWKIAPYLKHGYPTLYYQFLANVINADMQDLVVPVANSSLVAARWFAAQKFSADLIYIDASHDQDDVYNDLNAYWKILRMGGVICGDDFLPEWYPVICAVNQFTREKQQTLHVLGRFWAIQKTLAPETSQLWGAMSNELNAIKSQLPGLQGKPE